MNLVKFILKFAVKTPHIEDSNSFLFIGPHPDDIEIGAGATVAKLISSGKKITFLICTDGRFGDVTSEGIIGEELVRVRKEEALASAKILGVSDVRFLDLCDGGCYDSALLQKKIAEVISAIRPDIVFAPDSRSLSESHPDHLLVGDAARKVVCLSPYKNLMLHKYGSEGADVKALALYMTARPNRFVKVKGLLKLQFRALFDCHKSQYPIGSSETEALKLYLKLRYYQYWGREGFRVYSQTHLHCLPEAE